MTRKAELPRPCRACGMTIRFAESESGRWLPLQKVRNVYYISNVDEKAYPVDFTSEDGMDASGIEHYVSHFETCPKASSFTRKGSRSGGTARGSRTPTDPETPS